MKTLTDEQLATLRDRMIRIWGKARVERHGAHVRVYVGKLA